MVFHQKSVAVLLVCVVLATAIHVTEGGLEHKEKAYKKCLENCQNKCRKDNNRTFCEQKCDEDCSMVEAKGNTAVCRWINFFRFIISCFD